jgi:hypothetical protein
VSKLVPVSSFADLKPNSLRVTIDRVPDTMADKIQRATLEVVRSALSNFGFHGHWRLTRVERQKSHKQYYPVFKVKGLAQTGNQLAIAIITKPWPKDRDCCFSSLLIPPESIDVQDAFYHMCPFDRPVKPGEAVIPKAGDIYLGTVVDLSLNQALVQILPDNPPHIQNGVLHVTEIAPPGKHISKPSDEIHKGQRILVKVLDKDNLSRKVLLPHLRDDNFSAKPLHGCLNMRGFTKSDERVMVALDIVCSSVEAHATRAAWDRVWQDYSINGCVYPDGPEYPYAPAKLVWEDLRIGLCGIYKAQKISRINGIFRYLAQPTRHGEPFIFPYLSKNGKPIGYYVFDEAYTLLNRTRPPAAPYYKPPASVKQQSIGPALVEPIEPIEPVEPVESVESVESTVEKKFSIDEHQLDEFLVIFQHFHLYSLKYSRLMELDKLLCEHDALIEERNAIRSWMNSNPDIVRLGQALQQRIKS